MNLESKVSRLWTDFGPFAPTSGDVGLHLRFAVRAAVRYNEARNKEYKMAEKTSRTRKSSEEQIPSEAREHLRAARDEMRKSFEAMLPPGFKEHRQTARKEMLLAFRSMIDAAIEHTEDKKKTA
jgi:hypothetical protein